MAVAGAASAALGLIAWVGWYLGISRLVEVHPGFTPMAYNTSVGFVALGLAFMALAFDRRWAARFFAGVAGVVTGVRLLQYVTGAAWGLETLLRRFTLPHSPIGPVAMAPNTAIGLLSIAVAVWLSTTRGAFRGQASGATFCGSASAALGLNAFVGYMTGLQTYMWGDLKPMALHTSIGLMVLGGAIVTFACRKGRGVQTDWRARSLVIVITGGLVTSLSFWQALSLVEKLQIESVVRLRTGTPETVLIFSLVMTALLGTALYLAQTARLRAVRLERANAYNRSLLEASLDPLVTIAPNGKITDVNHTAEEVTGFSRLELIGTDFSDYFTESQKAREGYQKVFREGQIQDYELAIRRRDGHVTPVLYSASVYRNEYAEVAGVFAAARDISARKRIEEELRFSKERLALAQKAGKSGTFDWDIVNNVNIWTPEVEAVYGIEPGCFGGRYEDWEALVLAEDLDHARTCLQNSLKTGELSSEWRIRRRSDGEVCWIDARAKVLFDEAGRPQRMIGINTDITERKRAERALERKATDLARSNADLEQFAYVASHDLQEPLRMVANFTQLLADRYGSQLGAEGAEFVGYAVDGATRMQRLIQDLLLYSRVGTRGQSFEATDCNEVLGEAVANLQFAIQENGAVITHEELPTLKADASQFAQLFQNLVGNAIKFRGDAAPRVHVSAARQENHWVFAVRDNGIGIAPEFSDRIFVIFQRLHSRGEYPGTGIGLAVCKKIVERHGGRIWVESEPGKGSTFRFTIRDLGGSDEQ